MASAGDIKAGGAFVEISARDKMFAISLQKAENRIASFGKRVEQSLKPAGEAFEKFGGQLMRIAAIGFAPFAAGVKVFAGLEQQLANLQASANLTDAQLGKVRDSVMAISEATGAGPAAVASAMMELVKAGMSVEEAMGGAAAAVVKFARVGELDAAEAAVTLNDAVNVFAKSGINAEQAANILSAAADSSSASIQQITQAFAMSGAVWGSAGYSLKNLSTAIALMANAGIKGSDAGTSLKTALMRLQVQTDDAAAIVEEYGLRFRDATGHMRPMTEIIAELTGKLGSLDEATKDVALQKLFGADALRAAQTLMRVGTSGWDKMTTAMDDALPVAAKYQKVMDTIQGKLVALWSAVERAAAGIGKALGPALSAFGTSALNVIKTIGAWIERNQGLVVGFAKVLAVVGATGLIFKGIGMAMTGVLAPINAVITTSNTLIGVWYIMAAHPVIAVLAGLAIAATAVGVAFAATREEIAKTSDEAQKLREAGDAQRQLDQLRMERLDQLAKKERLNSSEMTEAQKIITALTAVYGDLGISIDKATGKIVGLTDAQKRQSKQARELAERQLMAEFREAQANASAAASRAQAPTSFFGAWWAELGGLGSAGAKTARAAALKEANAYIDQMEQIRKRIAALYAGDKTALTGEPGGSPGGLGGKTEEAKLADAIAADNAAAKDILDFRKDLDERMHRARLNMIADEEQREIQAIRDKYAKELAERKNLDGQTRAMMDAAMQAELDAVGLKAQRTREEEARRAEETRKAKAESIQDEIDRLRIETRLPEGIQREFALLELEKQRALREAAAAGLGFGAVNELYALKQAQILQGANRAIEKQETSQGTFSAFAASRITGAGSAQERTAKAAERQVTLQERIEKNTREGLTYGQ